MNGIMGTNPNVCEEQRPDGSRESDQLGQSFGRRRPHERGWVGGLRRRLRGGIEHGLFPDLRRVENGEVCLLIVRQATLTLNALEKRVVGRQRGAPAIVCGFQLALRQARPLSAGEGRWRRRRRRREGHAVERIADVCRIGRHRERIGDPIDVLDRNGNDKPAIGAEMCNADHSVLPQSNSKTTTTPGPPAPPAPPPSPPPPPPPRVPGPPGTATPVEGVAPP
ncbi:MAG: hypothetical protein EOQ93_30045 [Mesorhizobium sp.]|nr:hypothetical protein EJ078_22870 [Mesorhizobium sp. M1A.F.Ca.IN.022.06.1.1]RWH57860.1 MAG: hypothetical protein EOQ81_14855 [Mesorhizobium sp.]RWH63427.1 MAG: hypothetical protein EOQ83_15295 [Mesorhizobium sp.]RWI46356.1 MAG: hypothetical protein EOQ93_30045 [Mesorhizobium sp.]TIR91895.1 MAG: hypothetical protein E5X08_16800 [Mesorhizobium sp.]